MRPRLPASRRSRGPASRTAPWTWHPSQAQLDDLRSRALAAVAKADDPAELDAVESAFLGRNGELRKLLGGIGQLPGEDRPKVGALANPIREELEASHRHAARRLDEIALEVRLARESVDVTLPGRALPRGSLHPLIETQREIARVFGEFGFVIYDAPEVETDELNFEALNIPSDHPARDLWDTLYVAGTDRHYVLRTHTSPGQIRVMRATKPPIRALLPGRCFRYEAVDASHGFEFFQVEGLMVDEGTTHGPSARPARRVRPRPVRPQTATRFRPGYYPFTEPSVAFDISCTICGGVGCAACKRSGWLTILGAGMVHPVVLRNGGIDPERYQGFAFGMGTDRITMLRHGITDIRAFLEDDMRFLGSF